MKSLEHFCLTIIIVCLFDIVLSIFVVFDVKSNYKSKEIALIEQYKELEEENDILYDFIENIDTFKTLDDAVESSQDLIDYLQFNYE